MSPAFHIDDGVNQPDAFSSVAPVLACDESVVVFCRWRVKGGGKLEKFHVGGLWW